MVSIKKVFIPLVYRWHMLRYGRHAAILWKQQQIFEQYSSPKFRDSANFRVKNKLLARYRHIHFGIYSRRENVTDALKVAGISLITAITVTAFSDMLKTDNNVFTTMGFFAIILWAALAGIMIIAALLGSKNKTYSLYFWPYEEALVRELLEKYHSITFEAGKPVIHYNPERGNLQMFWPPKWKRIPNFEKSYHKAEWRVGEYRAVQQVEQEIRTFYANEHFKSAEGKRVLFMHFNDSLLREKNKADKKAEVYLQLRLEIIIAIFTAAFLSMALQAVPELDTNFPITVYVWAVIILGLLLSHVWGGLISEWRDRPNSAYYYYVVPFRQEIIKNLLEQVHHVEFKDGLPVVDPLPMDGASCESKAPDAEPAKKDTSTV